MRNLIAFVGEIISFRPWKLLFALLLILVTSSMEGVGYLMLQPLLNLANVFGLTHATPGNITSGFMQRFVAEFDIHFGLVEVLLFYVFIIGFLALLNYFEKVYNSKLAFFFTYHFQQKLHNSFLGASWLAVARTKRSDLSELLTSEIENISVGIEIFIQLLSSAILTLIYLLVAFLISWQMTLIALGCGVFIYAILRGQSRLAYKIGMEHYEYNQQLYGAINEHLAEAKLAKTYGQEEKLAAHFKKIAQNLVNRNTKFVSLQALNGALYTLGGVIAFSIIFYDSVARFHIPLTTLFVLLIIFARLIPKISTFQQEVQTLAHTTPSFQAVKRMEEELQKDSEKTQPVSTKRALEIKEGITFRDVSFSYDANSKKRLFSKLNLTIPAKQATAIVGPSGAGKSTLVDLLSGLLQPNSGEILYDDILLTPKQQQALKNSIGYVPQDGCLVNDTIKANLLWAAEKVPLKNIIQVLKMANAYDFVNKLPQKLDTIVGDNGVTLSGGERQRLMLARALLRLPSILILDEATSSLDKENEAAIFNAIRKLSKNITVIIVTHRTSSIDWVDNKITIENGKIKK